MASVPKLSFIQSELFWVFLGSIAIKIWLNTKDAQETFGTLLMLVKQINGSIMVLAALLSGKRFFDFVVKVRKMPETLSEIAETDDTERT